MAKLVDVYRNDNQYALSRRQLPLVVDDNIVMVLDLNDVDLVCGTPVVRGRDRDDFLQKYYALSSLEIKRAFEVPCKDLLAILSQTVPCVGCRRSAERLFYQLVKSGHNALDPIFITSNGVLSMKKGQLEKPQELCTLLHGQSVRLSNLVESQPRSKKSHRCNLHSLDSQRSRPTTGSWRDIWKCMQPECKDEVLLIEASSLLVTVETYLRKHRFCGECRTKVMRAYTLLVEDPDPTLEKGYVAALYSGIKRCLPEKHLHLQRKTEYIAKLIGRAEPELMGSRRERHAKTIQIAQEEVLTCLGLCVHERLHRIHLRLKEEECTCQVLAAVAVEAMGRSFETAVEVKQGVTRLELLYEEITKEELVKEQKKEHKKQKRRKKKERKAEQDGVCECESEENAGETPSCDCSEKVVSLSRSKISPECDCEDCLPIEIESCSVSGKGNYILVGSPRKSAKQQGPNKTASMNYSEVVLPATSTSNNIVEPLSPCQSCNSAQDLDTRGITKNRALNTGWSSSEHSQDFGYSSENNNGCGSSVSGLSSLASSPEGSEVACSEGLCNHDQTIESRSIETAVQRGSLEPLNLNNTRAGGIALTLQQMLDDSCSSDDDGGSYLSAAEVQEFKSTMLHVTEKRQELRLKLKERFNKLCVKPHAPCFTHCASKF